MKILNSILALSFVFAVSVPRPAKADNNFCKVYVPAMAVGLVITLIAARGSAARISAGIYAAGMLPCLYTIAYAKDVLSDTEKALNKNGPYTVLVETVGQNDANYIMERVIQGASKEEIAHLISELAGPEDNMS